MLKIYINKIKDKTYKKTGSENEKFSKYWLDKFNKASIDKRKNELYFSYMLLKKALDDIGVNEADIIYEIKEYGKPYIYNIDNLYFNISHSGEYVVLALSDEEIGIDIQKKDGKYKEIARRFFSNSENEYLKYLDEDKRENEFYRIWSVKESYIKYTGRGLSCPLNSFSVLINKDNNIRIDSKDINIHEIDWIDGYSISICTPIETIDKNSIYLI